MREDSGTGQKLIAGLDSPERDSIEESLALQESFIAQRMSNFPERLADVYIKSFP